MEQTLRRVSRELWWAELGALVLVACSAFPASEPVFPMESAARMSVETLSAGPGRLAGSQVAAAGVPEAGL